MELHDLAEPRLPDAGRCAGRPLLAERGTTHAQDDGRWPRRHERPRGGRVPLKLGRDHASARDRRPTSGHIAGGHPHRQACGHTLSRGAEPDDDVPGPERGRPRDRLLRGGGPERSAARNVPVRPAAILVLWDIDHTLLRMGPRAYDVYPKALEALTGQPCRDPVETEGRTELAIMHELLARVGGELPPDEQICAALVAAVAGHGEHYRRHGRALPGA